MTQAELSAREQVEQPTMANTLAVMQRGGRIDAARSVNDVATRGLDEHQAAALMDAIATAIEYLD